MSSPAHGFKQCRKCHGTMSVTDRHRRCLWCLGADHPIDDCEACQAMKPKTIRERRAKMAAGPPERRERGKPSTHRDQPVPRGRSPGPKGTVRASEREPAPRRTGEASPRRSPRGSPRRAPVEPTERRPPAAVDQSGSTSYPPRSKTREHRHSGSSASTSTSRHGHSRSPRHRRSTSRGPEDRHRPRISPHRGSGHRPPRVDPPSTQASPVQAVPVEGTLSLTQVGQKLQELIRCLPPSLSPWATPVTRSLDLVSQGTDPIPSAPATSVPGQFGDPRPPKGLGGAQVRTIPAGLKLPRVSALTTTGVTFADTLPGCSPVGRGSGPEGPESFSRLRSAEPGPEETFSGYPRRRDILEEPESEGEGGSDMAPIGRGPVQTLHDRLIYASGLDTSPDSDLAEPDLGFYPEQGSGYWHVVRQATSALGIALPTPERTTNVLTEILDAPEVRGAAALPFSAAMLEPLTELWEHPCSTSTVDPSRARKYKPAPGDPACVRVHPTPESLVVQAATVKSGVTTFPVLPPDRDSKRFEAYAKKTYASCSLGLRALNANCTFARYAHALFKDLQNLVEHLPDHFQAGASHLVAEGLETAKETLLSGMDAADAVGRSMGTLVTMRRHAWLRTSNFSPDVQSKLLDMPFDGSHLFGAKADEALEKFSTSRKAVLDLGLEPAPKPFSFSRKRTWPVKFRVPAKKAQSQKQFPLPARGRGRGRGKGQRQMSSKPVAPSTQPSS